MSQADDLNEGLAALLADVLSEGAPDPALLARYADDPSGLSLEERQLIEQRLAESPEVRDQLEVLKRFDSSEARQTSGRKSRSWLTNALVWIRRLFAARPVLAWTPPIAVAALVLVLIYPRSSSIRSDRLLESAPFQLVPLSLPALTLFQPSA